MKAVSYRFGQRLEVCFDVYRTLKQMSETVICGVLDVRVGVMSSKRKTSAPTRVLVDTDSCQSEAAVDRDAPTDHEYDSDQSHERSLKVVTSPSSLSADDDDVTDDVTACSLPESSCVALNLSTPPAPTDAVEQPSVSASSSTSWRRQWLSAEVTCVLKKIESVVAAAQTLDEKRRRVDEMLTELETIRRHLLTLSSDTTTTTLSVSVT